MKQNALFVFEPKWSECCTEVRLLPSERSPESFDWHIDETVFPSLRKRLPEIRLDPFKTTSFGTREAEFDFMQVMVNFICFNNLEFSNILKFKLTADGERIHFLYFLCVDEPVVVPKLPSSNVKIRFTLFDNTPTLRISFPLGSL